MRHVELAVVIGASIGPLSADRRIQVSARPQDPRSAPEQQRLRPSQRRRPGPTWPRGTFFSSLSARKRIHCLGRQ